MVSRTIKVEVVKPFFDKYCLEIEHKVGEILELSDIDRVRNMAEQKLIKLKSIIGDYECKDNDVVIYTSRIFKIGGIETACENLARAFKNRPIVFLFGECDIEQALRISEYRPVKIDDGSNIDCKVLLVMGYDGLNRIRAKEIHAQKIYHQIHADWATLHRCGMYKSYKLSTEGVDKFIAVSETAQKGLKQEFGIDSVIVPNILCPEKYGEFRIFLTLSRLEAEKGGNILLDMLERFTKANKHFLWIICGGGSQQSKIMNILRTHPNVMLLPSSIENKWLLPKVDYLVQTSLSESYCYSVREALSVGTPVISTRVPEVAKIIKNGENGYLVDFDLHDLDIEKIFEKKPQVKLYTEKVDSVWEDVLLGLL